ncbi:MAG: alpha-amylase family glycosyl hydrolase [Bacteroidota bacterium]|nr:alpha-amylase family glycosyl hydrolase [Bacteroidota bacterium]MDP4273554.1 alpha-amylase family glycosyl hydrolase [Bacteroidota bacterium]
MKKQLLIIIIFSFLLNIPIKSAIKDSIQYKSPIRPKTPEWVDHAVFYQIYPQTFYDSDSDGIGDLKGITEKLDYIKSLGVNAIWINPFYESPFRDAGYDVSNYYKVAPRYGTNEDARNLFEQAHKCGIHIIMDYVPGHTSIDHPWFKASCDSKPNKYSNWYIWTNSTWFAGMEKYSSNFIQGYCNRDGNFMTNFFWHQPALNYGFAHPDPSQPWQLPVNHPDVLALKAEMRNVMKFWLDMGADGFRVDMAGSLIKNDDGTACAEYWKGIREWLDKNYPEAFMISEWSNPVKSIGEGGFHADFNHWSKGYESLYQKQDNSYFSRQGKGNISDFLKTYLEQWDATKEKGYISLPIGNHDMIRIKNNGRTDEDIELIFAFMLTMPGVPFIYYGDEIGMKQLYGIPVTEGSYGARAGARTPMQWSSGHNCGFSKADSLKLYRAVDTSACPPNVMSEEEEQNSLLNKVKRLIYLKNQEPALAAYADFIPLLDEKNQYPFAYFRADGKEKLLIVINPSSAAVEKAVSLTYKIERPKVLAGKGVIMKIKNNTAHLKMQGMSYVIIRMNARK